MTDELVAPLSATHRRAALHNACDALLEAMPASAVPALHDQVAALPVSAARVDWRRSRRLCGSGKGGGATPLAIGSLLLQIGRAFVHFVKAKQ
ncbi:MAG: hypothetical protein IKE14_09425 [Loktanella sp.]|nr:hypothetical protein [Loktanella sp.]